MTRPQKPVFSNLIELDSGYVTAGVLTQGATNTKLSDDDLKTDLYRPQYDAAHVKQLMEHAVEEYNKSQPRIKVALYRVSTLSRSTTSRSRGSRSRSTG